MLHYFDNSIIIGLVGTLLFRFRNPDKHYLNLVSVGILLVSSLPLSYFIVGGQIGFYLCWLSVLVLIVAYILRFLSKNPKGLIEYIKLFAAFLFSASPVMRIEYFTWLQKGWHIPMAFQNLVIPIAGIVFVYDRWILKPEPMKKKFIIVLVLQTLLILIAFLYAFVQQIEASKNADEAIRQRNLAEVSKMEADLCEDKCEEKIRRLKQN